MRSGAAGRVGGGRASGRVRHGSGRHRRRRRNEARERRDAFTGERKRTFLKALEKSGCLSDACRAAGISRQTAYNHQESDAEFAENVETALSIAGTPVELVAWKRAVIGVEEEVFAYGKVCGTRVRRSDHLLALLLKGSNPKKYGARAGFTRKRLLKHERKQIEREIHAGMAEHQRPIEQVRASILERLDAIERHGAPDKLAAGWTRTGDGDWIPPGWVRADGRDAGGSGNVGDSMSNLSNSPAPPGGEAGLPPAGDAA